MPACVDVPLRTTSVGRNDVVWESSAGESGAGAVSVTVPDPLPPVVPVGDVGDKVTVSVFVESLPHAAAPSSTTMASR
jgi:hypothetical protein